MGANVGRKFVEAGFTVLTNLEGRSEATRKRAIEAGLTDASWPDIIQRSDIILSIIPPRDAVSFAEHLLKEFNTTKRPDSKDSLIFADCNAVNVDTIKSIAAIFAGTPIAFIDACIIGGPPTGTYVPIFYGCADPQTVSELKKFEGTVRESGIRVKVLDGEGAGISDASALKMSYAVRFYAPRIHQSETTYACFFFKGISKGLTGLFTTIILGKVDLEETRGLCLTLSFLLLLYSCACQLARNKRCTCGRIR